MKLLYNVHLADLAFFAKCFFVNTLHQVSLYSLLLAEAHVVFCAAVGNLPLLCHLCGLHDDVRGLLLRGDQGSASGGVPLHIQEALVLEEVSHHFTRVVQSESLFHTYESFIRQLTHLSHMCLSPTVRDVRSYKLLYTMSWFSMNGRTNEWMVGWMNK